MLRLGRAALAVWLLCGVTGCAAAGPPRGSSRATAITLDARTLGATISPTLFGLMFEEINHSGDGGIYAELLANRAMVDALPAYDPWDLETTGKSAGSLDLDTADPVNTVALTESLRLTISRVAPGESVGAVNPGYFGIPVWPDTHYSASFYARSGAGFSGPLSVRLESASNAVLAQATVQSIGRTWQHYALTLTTNAAVKASEDNHLVVAGAHTGTVWLCLVSLFPPTWNNRPNGMRIDLMSMLQALQPGFVRFPGGNYLEGQTPDSRFIWENTIGPLAARPGHPDDAWGYRSTDGLGLLEYLEWCADLHAAPVLAVYAGYSLDGTYVPAGSALQPYVQDALDEIQYATGAPSTKWGARRAADGHPAPFEVRYVEIGNEDFFDRSGSYDSRFTQFHDAIHAAYPSIKLIATSTDATSRRPDLIDLHFYETPEWFAEHTGYFDHYSRTAPQVLVGEYAAQPNGSSIARGQATLGTAIGEAAWMTGLERNSDVVQMASYAPLFQNLNGYQWSPDLISYDALHSYGSPSYYVQQLFSTNHGDRLVPVTGDDTSLAVVASSDSRSGLLYLTVVNSGSSAREARIRIMGVNPAVQGGTVTVLTSANADDGNSLDAPDSVHPVTGTFRISGQIFTDLLPPRSVTVFRLATRHALH